MKRSAVLLSLLLAGGIARADVFGVGDKHSGDLDLSVCATTKYINEYTSLSNISVDGLTLTVTSSNNFANLDLVMVWQPANMAAGTVPSGTQTEFTFTGSAGQYELARVSSKPSGTTLLLTSPLSNRAFSPNHAQVVKIPEYGAVMLGASCTLAPGSAIGNTPQPWDGATGGIVAFFSDDTGNLVNTTSIDGIITADFNGFQGVTTQSDNGSTGCSNTDGLGVAAGGSFRGENITSNNFPIDIQSGVGNIANGGGGGNCSQSGGGGGGNGGNGVTSNPVPGRGGLGGSGSGSTQGGKGGAPVAWRNINSPTDATYASQAAVTNGSLTQHLTFGGAGGHGQTKNSAGMPGGRGGGIIFIRANHLPGTGSIHANGVQPTPPPTAGDDGQGGGGAGGVVIIRLQGSLGVPCGNIAARGGNGGSTPSNTNVGGGGGGAGGRILVQSSNVCSTSVVTGGTGGTVNGGPNGLGGNNGSRESIPHDGVFCKDVSADSLCASVDGTKPHCNINFNFCAECGADNHCGNPNKPVCDLFGGTCTCTDDSQCPASAPVCNQGARTCEATCDSNGGNGFCLARFTNTPGAKRFCENGGGLQGQCVQCLSPNNNSQCPVDAPVCTSDVCGPCSSGSLTACTTDHLGTVCDLTGDAENGQCVQCVTAATCSGTNGCVSHICTSCNSDPSCTDSTSGPRCSSGSCVECLDANDCSPGQGCVTNACGNCSGNASCTNSTVGPFCVGIACVECRDAGDCASGQGCVNNVCTTCNGNPACSGSVVGPFCVTGACVECRNAADCSAGQGCATHVCGSCGSNDANCAGSSVGLKCNVNACVECLANTDCGNTAKPQCTTNACVACSADAGCTGHAKTLCELTNGTNPSLVGTCVNCRSNNTSFDCKSDLVPRCDSTVGDCTTCNDDTPGTDVCGLVANSFHTGHHCETQAVAGKQGQCVQCRGERSPAQTDCTSATPLCSAATDTCGPCDDPDPTSHAECLKFGADFVCDNPGAGGTGACVGCTTDDNCLDPINPHCVAKQCVACNGTTITHGDESCTHFNPDAGVPACQPNDTIASNPGECRQCSFFNRGECTGSTPACNFVSGACQLCTVDNGDMGAQSSGCSANTNGHACQGSGTSVFCGCTTDADCGSSTSGRICDTITSLCQDGCSRATGRNNCPSAQFCSSDDTTGSVTGVCTMTCQFDSDCATMTTMPFCINVQHSDAGVDAGNMGRCAGCRTDSDCSGQTPVCEPTLKVCVQCTDTRLDICSTAGAGAICLPNETCGCAADSDCGAADSGRICDLMTTHKCTAGCRVVGGNGCPAGLICDGTALVPGKCVAFVDMAMNIPDASEQDLSVPIDMAQNTSYRLQGGGIGCSVGGPSDVSFGALMLLALAALGLRRRRRQ